MGRFATRTLRAPETTSTPGQRLAPRVALTLPPRFLGVGEALALGMSPIDLCTTVGRELVDDGISLHEALEGLRATYDLVLGTTPDFEATQAMCVAWSEATVSHLHQVTCADPLTGLTSLAYLRTRINELYRGEFVGSGPRVDQSYALVVVEVARPASTTQPDPIARALTLAEVGMTIRTVFAGSETVARVGTHRVVTLARADVWLPRRTALLRSMLEVGPTPCRVWREALPGGEETAGLLVDELAR